MSLPIVDVAGDAHARGLACGRAVAERISSHLDAWLQWLAGITGRDAEAYVREMVAATRYRDAIAQYCPDLLDEVLAIAEAARLDPTLVYGLQLMDEEWFHRRRIGAMARTPDKCSSFAVVAGPSEAWIGQNMDLGAYTDGHQVALRLAPHDDAPGARLFTTAGVIALMGVNDAGLGVCVNSLPQLPSAPSGVPVAFVVRRLLQARSLAEAATLVQALPHATNQHYLIAEPGAVRSFEASAAGVVEYAAPDPARIFHTNHPLSDVAAEPETPQQRRNSAARLQSLVGRLAEAPPDAAVFQAALSASDDPGNPVCRTGGTGDIGFTCGSMVAELRAAAPGRCWMSQGPPTRGYAPVAPL